MTNEQFLTCTRAEQQPVGEHEEGRHQLVKQSHAAINHLWRQWRENDHRTLSSYHTPLSFLHSVYISIYVLLPALPPPPSSIPALFVGASLYF